MSELTFMMGEFEALLPTDRLYCANHMWAKVSPESAAADSVALIQFGFTAYAVRLLQDVYFLDWEFDAPVQLSVGQEFGSIESKKAESSLYSPVAGKLVRFNEALMEDPSAINIDKHGDGWLFEMEVAASVVPGDSAVSGDASIPSDPAEQGSAPVLLQPEAYVRLLEEVWVKTQRMVKGQLN